MATNDIYGTIGNFLGGAIGSGAQMYGQQNAAEAVEHANNAAITNQNTTLGNISKMYTPYTAAGGSAETALSRAMGTAPGQGGKPDYSGFEHMPGYDFAVQAGTQAIQRQAAASGNAYTPNTQAAVGQYVTGTAMQDYNTYVSQLQAQANMGETAANQIGNITYNTGANTSQLMANTGQSQAGMYTGMAESAAEAIRGGGGGGLPAGLAALLGGGGGAGGGGGIAPLIAGGLRSLFSGGGSAGGGGTISPNDPYGGMDVQPPPSWDSSWSPDTSNFPSQAYDIPVDSTPSWSVNADGMYTG